MVAESGAVLLDPSAKAALIERMLPRATVVTPNLAEARELTGLGEERLTGGAGAGGAGARARTLSSSPAATPRTAPTSSSTATARVEIDGPRHPDGASHGSGCTHSSALAARLALGDPPLEAARAAARSPPRRWQRPARNRRRGGAGGRPRVAARAAEA